MVASLRLKTLDVVEAVAAWQRKTNSSGYPFIYRGEPYLPAMGPDLHFLDRAPFLEGRFVRGPASSDPFLMDLTPEGVPLEEADSFDMRRGEAITKPQP